MTAGVAGPPADPASRGAGISTPPEVDRSQRHQGGPQVRPGDPHGDPARPGPAGSWEAAHPRLTSFLGLLERSAARIPTGGRTTKAAPTRAPSPGPGLLPQGPEGAAGEGVAVAFALDAVPTGPALGPPRRGKGATR